MSARTWASCFEVLSQCQDSSWKKTPCTVRRTSTVHLSKCAVSCDRQRRPALSVFNCCGQSNRYSESQTDVYLSCRPQRLPVRCKMFQTVDIVTLYTVSLMGAKLLVYQDDTISNYLQLILFGCIRLQRRHSKQQRKVTLLNEQYLNNRDLCVMLDISQSLD